MDLIPKLKENIINVSNEEITFDSNFQAKREHCLFFYHKITFDCQNLSTFKNL